MAKQSKGTFSFMKGNVLVMTVSRLIFMFSNTLTFPYFPLYILNLGGSNAVVGLITAIGSLASLISVPVAGYLVDYKGRVKLIYVASYLQAFILVFYIFAQDWITLAIGRFLNSLITFHLPAMSAIIADSVSPEQRGLGFSTYIAISSFGVVSPFIGGYLISVFKIDLAMRFGFSIALILALTVAIMRHKYLKETVNSNTFETRITLRSLPSLFKKSYKSIWEAFKWMPNNLRAIAFISTSSVFFNSIVTPFWVVYATTVIRISAFEWGLMELVVGGLRLSLSPLAGLTIDKYGKRKCILGGVALSILPTFYFIYSTTFLGTLALLLIISVANTFLAPACYSLIADIVPKEKRGRIMAAFGQGTIGVREGALLGGSMGFALSLAMMLGSSAGGYIYSFDPVYPWFILSTALVVILVLSIRFIHDPKKPEL